MDAFYASIEERDRPELVGRPRCQRLPHRRLSVRLLGVGVSGLVHPPQVQRLLFEADQHAAQSNVDQATDQIRQRFGADALRRASGLLHHARHQAMPRPQSDRP